MFYLIQHGLKSFKLKMTAYKIKYDHPNHLNITTTYYKHKNNVMVVKKKKKDISMDINFLRLTSLGLNLLHLLSLHLLSIYKRNRHKLVKLTNRIDPLIKMDPINLHLRLSFKWITNERYKMEQIHIQTRLLQGPIFQRSIK
jgi:hypothetical protein